MIAALLGFAGVIATLYLNGRRSERLRLRELYANGYAAVTAYKEFAFAIRRRDHTQPAAERVRLSDGISNAQRELAYYEAFIGQRTTLLRRRPTSLATAYLALVGATRSIAGGIIRRSWDQPPVTTDKLMHAPTIAGELAALTEYEAHYLKCINNDLAPWWRRRRHLDPPAPPQSGPTLSTANARGPDTERAPADCSDV